MQTLKLIIIRYLTTSSAKLSIFSVTLSNTPNIRSSSHAIDSHKGLDEPFLDNNLVICSSSNCLLYVAKDCFTISYNIL